MAKNQLNLPISKENLKLISKARKTFATIFIFLAIVLLISPIITTSNEVLTSLVMKINLYQKIQNLITPPLIQMMAVILSFLGIKTEISLTSLALLGSSKKVILNISWNCIGWQSLFLLGLTFFTGLSGNYLFLSKLRCIAIGILGTFLVNIFRMTIVALIAFSLGSIPAIIFHDYFANFIPIIWFFIFWKFSFNFVLEEKSLSLKP